MERVLGIDLGTTNCCVAIMEGPVPRVIANKIGYTTTPSIVAVTDDGKRLVGQLAARQAITNPEHTIGASKRLLGRRFDSPEVQHAMARAAYTILAGADGLTCVQLRDRTYSIPEIGALLLQEMRQIAEDDLEASVDKAVVTVPAYFNDLQRQAVREAGKLAGLDVIRIINEPTAAALAYGYKTGIPQTVAVYDLGGGTFDISIVAISAAGEFRVVATTGDSFLGGEDFDNRLVEWLIRGFYAHHKVDLRRSPAALQRLKVASQKAKQDLSVVDEVDLKLPFIVSTGDNAPLHMDYEITRPALEKLTADLVDRTIQICDHAMKHTGIRQEDIDEVLLVGGMTRMPAIQRAVQKFFGKRPSRNVNPDEAVAMGAAIQGAVLLNQIQDIELQDVTAHSLGIMAAGGRMERLIDANTRLPVRRERLFSTSRDDQTSVKIIVLQGDSPMARDNELLGEFALTGLRPAPAGVIELEVAFEIDEEGIFRVSATNLETGEDQTIEVLGHGRSAEEAGQEAEDLTEEAEELDEVQESRQRVTVLIEELDRTLTRAEPMISFTQVGANTIAKARQVSEHVRHAMASRPDDAMLKEAQLIDRVLSAISKMIKSQQGRQSQSQ